MVPNKKISEPFLHVIRRNTRYVHGVHSVCSACVVKRALNGFTGEEKSFNGDRSRGFLEKYKCTIFSFIIILRCCRWINVNAIAERKCNHSGNVL